MTNFKATIKDHLGLHARPASFIVQSAAKFKSEIWIHVGNKKGNLKSIMNIMALGVNQNDHITITAEGEDEQMAITKIKEVMIEKKLI